MKQLSPQEASALKRTRFWERLTTRQIAEFQLGQDQLCMPLEIYQNALSVELDRGVFTHELCEPGKLRTELHRQSEAPSLEEIFADLESKLRHGK